MAIAQPRLLEIDPEELEDLEKRRLLAKQAMNSALVKLERMRSEAKTAKEAYQRADSAYARARYGDAWDGTLNDAELERAKDELEDEEDDDDLGASLIDRDRTPD